MEPNDTLDVRYFAAAAAATGCDREQITLPPGARIVDLRDALTRRHDRLGRVLSVCTLLLDGRAERDEETPVKDVSQVDVLPPFAGG